MGYKNQQTINSVVITVSYLSCASLFLLPAYLLKPNAIQIDDRHGAEVSSKLPPGTHAQVG